jgi:hypothetical protein
MKFTDMNKVQQQSFLKWFLLIHAQMNGRFKSGVNFTQIRNQIHSEISPIRYTIHQEIE